jgi:hypothetical protein
MTFARRFLLVLALTVTLSAQGDDECQRWLDDYNALIGPVREFSDKILQFEGKSEEACRAYVEEYRGRLQKVIDLSRSLDDCEDIEEDDATKTLEGRLASSSKWFTICRAVASGQSAQRAAELDESGGEELDARQLRRKLTESAQFYWTLIFGIVAGFAVVLGLTYFHFSRRLGSLSEPARIVSQSLTTMFRREAPGAGHVGGTVARQTGLQRPGTQARGGIGEVKLIPSEGGRPISLDPQRLRKGGIVIGRSSNCDVVLTDNRVSGRHARIWCDESGALRVEDLGSSNGTWRGGKRIERGGLASGDEIRFGAVAFKVQS